MFLGSRWPYFYLFIPPAIAPKQIDNVINFFFFFLSHSRTVRLFFFFAKALAGRPFRVWTRTKCDFFLHFSNSERIEEHTRISFAMTCALLFLISFFLIKCLWTFFLTVISSRRHYKQWYTINGVPGEGGGYIPPPHWLKNSKFDFRISTGVVSKCS